jgi:hypothetical protein
VIVFTSKIDVFGDFLKCFSLSRQSEEIERKSCGGRRESGAFVEIQTEKRGRQNKTINLTFDTIKHARLALEQFDMPYV